MSAFMSTKPATFDVDKGEYGIPDVMTYGLPSTKDQLTAAHPVESIERSYKQNQDMMTFNMLRKVQGLHAPIKLKMERSILSKTGGRLPFLPSSNASLDSLTGRDLEINFEDFLNTPEFREQMCHPHAQVEKSLGLL